MMTTVHGIAPFVPGATSTKDLLRALHSAAQDARASMQPVSVFSPALHDGHRRRFQLLQDFGAALDGSDQLRLVFQPRVDLATRGAASVPRCCCDGSTRRWATCRRAKFIPIVEQTSPLPSDDGLRPRLALPCSSARSGGRRACDLPLSINISAANLEENDFAEQVLSDLVQASPAARGRSSSK